MSEWTISVPAQGFEITFKSFEDFPPWLRRQREFWEPYRSVAQRARNSSVFQGHEPEQLFSNIPDKWRAWEGETKQGSNSFQPIKALIEGEGQRLSIMLPEGIIGERLEDFRGRANESVFTIAVLAMNTFFAPAALNVPPIAIARAVMLFDPMFHARWKVDTALRADEISRDTAEEMKKESAKFLQWRTNEEAEIGRLSDRFKKELPFEKPAVHWRRVQQTNGILAALYLIIFMVGAGLPIYLLFHYWVTLLPIVEELFSKSTSTIPIGPITVVLIPALIYGWFLKHISRLFLQVTALAIDAGHRRSLAITYLGLMDYEKTKITDAERAIILNALFRPPPPHSTDDGPPAGLLDLIRSKD